MLHKINQELSQAAVQSRQQKFVRDAKKLSTFLQKPNWPIPKPKKINENSKKPVVNFQINNENNCQIKQDNENENEATPEADNYNNDNDNNSQFNDNDNEIQDYDDQNNTIPNDGL